MENTAHILVVDDDPLFVTQMTLCLDRLGHKSISAASVSQGLEMVNGQDVDVVFLDVYLPDTSGIDGINRFRQAPSMPEVIIITGKGDPDSAELAIKKGAWHYLEKPASLDTIKLTLERVLQYRADRTKLYAHEHLARDGIIGTSPAIKHSLVNLALAASGSGSVVITGDTGTGKELFARALHANSARRDAPFVVMDCTNIPESLAESLLFGHVKGAFTNATATQEGLFAQADGGTLFLDEVGDLPMALQRSLLRVLQEKRFRPVGSSREQDSNFRVVAATNQNIAAMMDSGAFRKDLYYRLAQHVIHLPPLVDRNGDVELLAKHFVHTLCEESSIPDKTISTELLHCLRNHTWPGNIRELQNVLASAIAHSMDQPVLLLHHLPSEQRARFLKDETGKIGRTAVPEGVGGVGRGGPSPALPTLAEFRDEFFDSVEAGYLDQLLAAAKGDVQAALSIAGISRSRLYQLLKKHDRTMKKEG